MSISDVDNKKAKNDTNAKRVLVVLRFGEILPFRRNSSVSEKFFRFGEKFPFRRKVSVSEKVFRFLVCDRFSIGFPTQNL